MHSVIPFIPLLPNIADSKWGKWLYRLICWWKVCSAVFWIYTDKSQLGTTLFRNLIRFYMESVVEDLNVGGISASEGSRQVTQYYFILKRKSLDLILDVLKFTRHGLKLLGLAGNYLAWSDAFSFSFRVEIPNFSLRKVCVAPWVYPCVCARSKKNDERFCWQSVSAEFLNVFSGWVPNRNGMILEFHLM